MAGEGNEQPTIDLRRGSYPVEELSKSLASVEQTPELAARVIWEQMCFWQNQGKDVSLDQLIAHYPAWRGELEKLRESSGWSKLVKFPRVGEEIAGYQLVSELGRGGQGVVFLARQIPLAGRPVVLKFTACQGVEHLNLARLQHTCIVPLYGAEDFPDRNLRLLCMPFLGGITLTQLLNRLEGRPYASRTGAQVDRILEDVQAAFDADLPGRGNASEALVKLTYADVVCQIGLGLAEALDHAHKNGLVHLDIKPSNILLAPDGRPLLLDLHLAHTPLEAGETTLEDFGGTWRYMSPEQRDAVAAAHSGQALPGSVDHRSDIFSLGLVLYEALGGERNLEEKAEPWTLARRNPLVSPGLQAIVAKCLEEDPKDRYAEARLLAEDLRCHLEDRPLSGVGNRSWAERWRKWRRRKPMALPVYSLMIALAATMLWAGMALFAQYQERRMGAERALFEGQELLRKQRFEEAMSVLRRGQERADFMNGNEDLRRALDDHHRLAEHLHHAQQLHSTVNALRFNALIDPLPRRSLLVLDAVASNLWHSREQLREYTDLPVEPEIKDRIQADLRDLGLLRAEVLTRLASPETQKQAIQAALVLLDEAERSFGKHPALLMEQRQYAEMLGLNDRVGSLETEIKAHAPQSVWEHAFVARSHFRANAYDKAETELRAALELQPLHYLSHFYLGYCSYRQGSPAEGIGAFSFCLGQEPRSEGFYFRARCHLTLGQKEAAFSDLNQALQRDAYLGQAHFERGILHAEQSRLNAARTDFEQALAHGADPFATRCELAQIHISQKDWQAARSILNALFAEAPTSARVRALLKKIPQASDQNP